jgi:GDPmannose 4,6-dehydratase
MKSEGKRAIIVGSNGQDGRILFDDLAARDYSLIGIARHGTRVRAAKAPERVDIVRANEIDTLVREFQPDQIYYLAAFHHSSEDSIPLDSRQLFDASYQVHVASLINFLEAMASYCARGRLFYAASSLVFGNPRTAPQNEETPLDPVCIYGITKAAGIGACRFYRRAHSLFASVGILFNHESTYRRPAFVTQRIVRGALRIKAGVAEKLLLADLAARVDWGWAADYTRAAAEILDLPAADDFVLATGKPHTVQEFVEEAFGQIGLDWRRYVQEDPAILKRQRNNLVGDASKLNRATGWQPSVSFEEMIGRLLEGAEASLDEMPAPS